jgi:hypothetical protein
MSERSPLGDEGREAMALLESRPSSFAMSSRSAFFFFHRLNPIRANGARERNFLMT